MSSEPRGTGKRECWNCSNVVDAVISVEIRSQSGGRVTVPLCHSCYDSVYVPLAAEAAELQQDRTRSRSVLIVDDDPNIRGLLRTLFDGEGFSVDTAANGLEALNKVSAHIPDAIVLDMRMPVMSGPEFLQAWHRTGSGPTVPILAMSAYDTTLTAKELSVQAFLPKPFSMDAILSTVDQLIGVSGPRG